VKAIPDVFHLAQQLNFASIIFDQEIGNFDPLFPCGLRSYSALDFGNVHSSVP
jgi:hypothetical protein